MPIDLVIDRLLADATLAATAARALEAIRSTTAKTLGSSWDGRQASPSPVSLVAAICSLCHGLAIQGDIVSIAAAAAQLAAQLIVIVLSRSVPAQAVLVKINASVASEGSSK